MNQIRYIFYYTFTCLLYLLGSFLPFGNTVKAQDDPQKKVIGVPGSMLVESLSGSITRNEKEAFKQYMLNRVPLPSKNGGNVWVFGNPGKAIEACGLMYEATNDVEILNRMVFYCDAALAGRNDLASTAKGGQQIAWTGNVEPIWPSSAADVSPAGAGVEQGSVLAHLAYCAKLILQNQSLWNKTVPIGDLNGFGINYKARAMKYVAAGDDVMDRWILPRFIRSSDHNRYYFPGAPNTYKANEPAPWNQAFMVTNALVRLVQCHLLLNDQAERIVKYDGIIKPNLTWFLESSKKVKSPIGSDCRTWAYAYPEGMEDTNHFAYEAEGLWIAYETGRYLSKEDVMPYANTYMDIVLATVKDGKFAGRVDGTTGTGHRGGDNYVRDEYIYLTHFRPDKYMDIGRVELEMNKIASSPQITARLLWAKNRRYLKSGRGTMARLEKELLKSEDYIKRYGNLSNTLYRIKKEHRANVVFYGGSITHNPGWRELVMDDLQQQFPETKFNFLNAGIPSLGSLPHAFRINHDVLSKGRVDLVFLESAVNDSGNGTAPLTQRRALEGILRQLKDHNAYTDVVMMAFVDLDKIKAYNSGQVPAEVSLHEEIAKEFKLPFINLAKEVTDRIDAGEFTWDDDFKNLHPSAFGQHIYFRSIAQLLHVAFDQPVPGMLIANAIPLQTDALVYSKGTYLDIKNAKALSGFELISNWKPTDSARARGGFVNIPVLSASSPGASFALDFTGTAIGFALLAGPDAGVVSYAIDGKVYPEMDLYTPWSKNLHLPWYLLFADDLKPGPHQLKLTLGAAKNKDAKGTACRIAYFLLNNPAK